MTAALAGVDAVQGFRRAGWLLGWLTQGALLRRCRPCHPCAREILWLPLRWSFARLTLKYVPAIIPTPSLPAPCFHITGRLNPARPVRLILARGCRKKIIPCYSESFQQTSYEQLGRW